jgi:hypothetical protein
MLHISASLLYYTSLFLLQSSGLRARLADQQRETEKNSSRVASLLTDVEREREAHGRAVADLQAFAARVAQLEHDLQRTQHAADAQAQQK